MTTYLGYSELKTLLDTKWNDAGEVIAKPTFEDWLLSAQHNENSIMIRVFPAEAKFATNGVGTKDKIVTKFEMKLKTPSKTNTDLYLSEVRRIVNAKITNGSRHINSWGRNKSTDFFIYTIQGSEILYDFA